MDDLRAIITGFRMGNLADGSRNFATDKHVLGELEVA
jgi:hypothetical protein